MYIDSMDQVGLTQTEVGVLADQLRTLCHDSGASYGRLWLTSPQGAGPLAEYGDRSGAELSYRRQMGDFEIEASLGLSESAPEEIQARLETLATESAHTLADARLKALSSVHHALSKRLHDKVCQDLTAAKLELELLQLQGQAPPAVEKVIRFLHAASVEVRDILGDLKSG
ncbi:MAG: histidine kinase [Vulcanimicrobiota bacterium]